MIRLHFLGVESFVSAMAALSGSAAGARAPCGRDIGQAVDRVEPSLSAKAEFAPARERAQTKDRPPRRGDSSFVGLRRRAQIRGLKPSLFKGGD